MDVMTFKTWSAGSAARRAISEPFRTSGTPFPREKPRAKAEAEFLRTLGTPESKIGPVSGE